MVFCEILQLVKMSRNKAGQELKSSAWHEGHQCYLVRTLDLAGRLAPRADGVAKAAGGPAPRSQAAQHPFKIEVPLNVKLGS